MSSFRKIVFLTALPIEFKAVTAYLTNLVERVTLEGTIYEVGYYQTGMGYVWEVAVGETGMGNINVAIETHRAIKEFNPSYLFSVGLAGGIKHVSLGDVVIASKIIGYESAKVGDNQFKARSDVGKLSYPLVQLANKIIRKKEWVEKIADHNTLPQAHLSSIASGEKVITSTEFLKQLNNFADEAVAIEMGGIGFSQAIADNATVQGIVIRGISDLIMGKVPVHDKEWQPIAARNAAAFAFAMLDELNPESVKPDRSSRPVRFGENKSEEETPIFTIPLARNPRFVGRQDLLTQLHTTLATQRLVALCGLGGVGKTQLAVEYAYRHQQDYSAVLWLSLSSELEVQSRFATLAEGLGIPVLQQKQEDLVAQVKHWLASHQDWLLLVDNVDELDSLKSFMPLLPVTLTGRVLFTTRQQQPPLPIRCLAIETLTVEEGAKFIVQQVYEVTEAEVVQHGEYLAAQVLSQQLGGLPLALTQAAAYMRAHSCSCADYLDLYREYQLDLLAERGEVLMAADHPASVAITWEESLKPLRTQQPQAIELLYCCAVLHPDGIPEEVLMTALAVNKLQLDKLLKPLLSYSLLTRRTGQKEVSIHRLVQAVLRFELEAKWPEWVARLVAVVEKLFPETQESSPHWAQVEHWQRCEWLLPSALACAKEIRQSHLETDIAARLLQRLAAYLGRKADYEQSLQWYELALAIYEQMGGKAQSEVVSIRLSMADVYDSKSDYDKALSLCKETFEISENTLGKEHPLTAKTMDMLAWVYGSKGEYEKALPLYEQALAIQERVLGEEHLDTARCLDNLAYLYDDKGELEKALPLYQRVLKIREGVLGEEHPDTAITLNNLAVVYRAMGQYEKALLLHQRDLKISEQVSGKEHPDTATTLHNLAITYRDQGDYDHALPLLERALAIRTQHLDPDHPRLAQSYHDLGIFYQRQGQHDQALSYLERALTIRERKLGPDHPDTARTRGELALVYQAQGQAEKATECYETALATLRTRLPQHPDTQRVAENYQTWQAGLQKKRRGKKG